MNPIKTSISDRPFRHAIPLLAAILFLISPLTVAAPIEPAVEAAIEPPVAPAIAPTDAPPTDASKIERVATIGASATAGFGTYFWRYENGEPVRDSTTLARFLRAASDEQLVVTDLGTAQFFSNPAGIGSQLVTRAIRSRPDLVIGIDFLFWFCYGSVGIEARRMQTPEARMAMLDEGLGLLDQVVEAKIPLLIGDIPDMSAAGGGILKRSQVPPEAVRLAANERIEEWVAARPMVEIFSLDRLQTLLASEEPIEVDGVRLEDDERARLLQSDRLHPTLGGLSVIIAEIDRMLALHPFVGPRLPELEIGYAENLERMTGFRSLKDQDPIDREWWESRRTPGGDGTSGSPPDTEDR